MKPEELIGTLAAAARREETPRVDVAARVARRLTASPARRDPTIIWFAVGSAALAALTLGVSLPDWAGLADPLAQLMLSLGGGLP